MNNMLLDYGLIDARLRASEKEVGTCNTAAQLKIQNQEKKYLLYIRDFCLSCFQLYFLADCS
jgi:hypothetical protein